MHVSNEIVINAPAERIFERASATPRWPQMLPHYRYVRVLSSDGARSVVRMGARRGPIPVSWRAEQINDPAIPQIFFRHLGGWTKGMRVFWRFTSLDSGATHVCIDHDLDSPLAPIIAKFFIDPIATRTLSRMKALCEAP